MATTPNTDDIISDYVANFNPQDYLTMMTLKDDMRTTEPLRAAFLEISAKLLHDIFCKHDPGERLLDIGSGCTIWHVMSASAKYKRITLSDPVPQSRQALEQYITDASMDQRWTEHFKLTAKLEGDADKWPEVRDRMRSSISRVVWCDILQENPLGRNHELFDCVMASLCLEAAAKDAQTYTKAVKNLTSLAKPGAPVIMSGVLNQTYYDVGTCKFWSLSLTPEIIQESLETAGCTVTTLSINKASEIFPDGDFKGFFIVGARKN